MDHDTANNKHTDNTATSRIERMVGPSGLERLAATRVMVLGLGGVGSNCVEALARGGIGHFVLLDRDVVEVSNINRQAIAFHSTLGQRKVDVTTRMIADINPSAQVTTIFDFIREADLPDLFAHYVLGSDGQARVDWVIDAIDTISTKLAIAQLAQEQDWQGHGIKLLASMGGGNKLHPEYLRFADIYDTVNCRMSRIMRKEARKRGIQSLRVLYSCEQAAPATSVEGAARNERSGLGTMSYFPPIMGQMLASEVIRHTLELDPE